MYLFNLFLTSGLIIASLEVFGTYPNENDKLMILRRGSVTSGSISFISSVGIHSQKKGTKAVTGAVPFQKVNFCPFLVLICTF